jgi:hypothetical protein
MKTIRFVYFDEANSIRDIYEISFQYTKDDRFPVSVQRLFKQHLEYLEKGLYSTIEFVQPKS